MRAVAVRVDRAPVGTRVGEFEFVVDVGGGGGGVVARVVADADAARERDVLGVESAVEHEHVDAEARAVPR